MNAADLDPFLNAGMGICGAMAVISAFRHKSRGVSAFIMAGAFVVLGLGMLMVKLRASVALLIATGIVLILLLGIDFAARSAHRENKEQDS
jgi:hypothetical protein